MVEPPSSSDDSRSSNSSDNQDFETALNNAQSSLDKLRQRYAQINIAQEKRSELRVQYNRTQSELSRHRTKQLQEELKSIKQKLDDLEIMLESQLFSWSSLKEPFWMAVRFGGLGILMGWALRAIAN